MSKPASSEFYVLAEDFLGLEEEELGVLMDMFEEKPVTKVSASTADAIAYAAKKFYEMESVALAKYAACARARLAKRVLNVDLPKVRKDLIAETFRARLNGGAQVMESVRLVASSFIPLITDSAHFRREYHRVLRFIGRRRKQLRDDLVPLVEVGEELVGDVVGEVNDAIEGIRMVETEFSRLAHDRLVQAEMPIIPEDEDETIYEDCDSGIHGVDLSTADTGSYHTAAESVQREEKKKFFSKLRKMFKNGGKALIQGGKSTMKVTGVSSQAIVMKSVSILEREFELKFPESHERLMAPTARALNPAIRPTEAPAGPLLLPEVDDLVSNERQTVSPVGPPLTSVPTIRSVPSVDSRIAAAVEYLRYLRNVVAVEASNHRRVLTTVAMMPMFKKAVRAEVGDYGLIDSEGAYVVAPVKGGGKIFEMLYRRRICSVCRTSEVSQGCRVKVLRGVH